MLDYISVQGEKNHAINSIHIIHSSDDATHDSTLNIITSINIPIIDIIIIKDIHIDIEPFHNIHIIENDRRDGRRERYEKSIYEV